MYRLLYLILLLAIIGSCEFSLKSTVSQPGMVDSLVQKGDWGHLNISYPVYDNLYVDSVITVFTNGVVKNFRLFTGDERISENWSNEMQVSYSEYFANAGTVSVVFNIYQFTGGAHGNTFIRSIILDTENNKLLHLKDFISQEDFKKLQMIVREKLHGMLDFHDFINDGTEKWNDFSSFAVSDNDFTFWFSPYQVAPYSYGIQKLVIQRSEFSFK